MVFRSSVRSKKLRPGQQATEHRKVEEQDRKVEQHEATIAKQQKKIEALTAGLQK
jgi:hypothetical protein